MNRPIVVSGATGLQGGAVARRLLAEGRPVRLLTRRPNSARAQAMRALGGIPVEADLEQLGPRQSSVTIRRYLLGNTVAGATPGTVSDVESERTDGSDTALAGGQPGWDGPQGASASAGQTTSGVEERAGPDRPEQGEEGGRR